MTTSRSDHVKGRKATARGWVISAIILFYFAAILFGPRYLAPILSDTALPTQNDLKDARFLIASPGILIILLFLLWVMRTNRKAGPIAESRISVAPLDNVTKRSNVESQ